MRRLFARLARRLRGRQARVWEIFPGYMTERQIDDLVHGRQLRDAPPVRFNQPGVVSLRHLGRVS